MADPVTDALSPQWQPDATTADTNTPQGASSMAPGGPTELAGELRKIKSEVRLQSLNQQWERWGGQYGTLTYVSTTQFTLTLDQRTSAAGGGGNGTVMGFGPVEVNRRIKATVTAGTVYGYVSAVSFGGGLTTVTVVLDSGMLDAGLSEVQFGSSTASNSGLPQNIIQPASVASPLFAVASGTNTYVATLSPPIGAYSTGLQVAIQFTNANTGASTLNLNGLGAKAIVKNGATALSGGEISATQVLILEYDGTNFQLIGTGGTTQAATVAMGSSGSTANLIGTANVQSGAVGTPASTVETTLFTYTLPGNSLITNGQRAIIRAWGTFANNANGKLVRLYFGSTVLVISPGTTPSSPLTWSVYGEVMRTGAATQEALGHLIQLNVLGNGTLGNFAQTRSAPSETLSGAVVIKVTGQNSSASLNDIVGNAMVTEYAS